MRVEFPHFELRSTGAGYTTVFDHAFYYNVNLDARELKPCPIHVSVVKGYRNSRYYYQLIDMTKPVVTLKFVGSDNPRTGPTPSELLRCDVLELVEIENYEYYSVKRIQEIIEIIKENIEILEKDREFMAENSPGRTCLAPLKAEFVEKIVVSECGALDMAKVYPPQPPTWFVGGKFRIKGSYVKWDGEEYPVRQGNCIITPWFLGPIIAYYISGDDMKDADRVVIKGTEGNDHVVTFDHQVFVQYIGDQNAIVYSPRTVYARVTHPQHDPIIFEAKGWFRITHLGSRRG